MPPASPCRFPTLGAGEVGEAIGVPAPPAAPVAARGGAAVVAAGSSPVAAGGAIGAARGSTARVAPVRDATLPEPGSWPGDEAESRSAGSGGAGMATESARTPSATPVPGSDAVSCTALATVSGPAGCGEPKIHAASAHNTRLEARTRIPESRVMALPFVAGSTSGGHDSPIGRQCTGVRRPRGHPLQGRKRPRIRRDSAFGPPKHPRIRAMES